MGDPAVHAIAGFVLTFVTVGTAVELLLFLLVLWADRPYEVGRNEDGRPVPVRPVRRRL